VYSEKTENRGRGPGGHPYDHHQFTWYERHGSHRALGITRVHASVDTLGSLVDFVQVPPTLVTVSVEPAIARETAIALALERYGKPITASEAELGVWWEDGPDEPQVLRWIVSLTSTEPWHPSGTDMKRAGYAFDAHSGRFLWEYVSQDHPEAPPDDSGEVSL